MFQLPLLMNMAPTFMQLNGVSYACGVILLASTRRLLFPYMNLIQDYIGRTSTHSTVNLCCFSSSVIRYGYLNAVRRVLLSVILAIFGDIHTPKILGVLRNNSRQR